MSMSKLIGIRVDSFLRGIGGSVSGLRDLYATKDTYVSAALTRGVNLTWLSEQTGVADITLRKHYGRFIHSDVADALELAKIEAIPIQTVHFAPRLPLAERAPGQNAVIYKGKMVEVIFPSRAPIRPAGSRSTRPTTVPPRAIRSSSFSKRSLAPKDRALLLFHHQSANATAVTTRVVIKYPRYRT